MTTVQQTIGIQKGCGISVAPIFRRANPKYPKYLKWLNVSRSLEDNNDICADIILTKGYFQILFPGYNIGHLQTESSNAQKTVGMQKGPV